ncbi:uncharacterized protein [Oscarella lobularis]|uniref:uncharacterized protein isoform X2 n=1 Tax=Oscarella lobularis TaxID=121494 RepID=UPI003313A54F
MYSIRRFFSSEPNQKPTNPWARLSLEDKRKHYRCVEDYVTLDSLKTWQKYKTLKSLVARRKPFYAADERLNEKVTLWRGDITCLEIDAIVNAANSTLMEDGGGVDACINHAADSLLLDECRTLGGCDMGKAKLTSGYRLPAKYVLHAVGPIGKKPKLLRSCYNACLALALDHNIRSLAFCSISTGANGYPKTDAASVAIDTVRRWLTVPGNAEKIDRIIFCVYTSADRKIYKSLMPYYFPDAEDVQHAARDAAERTETYQQEVTHFQKIYHEALKRGSVTVNRSRVIVAGQDGAGKSCLVDSLLNRPFEKDKASTEGAVVSMIHTAACGWVVTDNKDHLDPLIAEGVYRMNQQQSDSFRRTVASNDFDSELEKVKADTSERSHGTSSEVSSFKPAPAVETLEENLKTFGIEAKTLMAMQQQLVATFLASRPSEEDLRKQIFGVRDIWDLGGQEIYLATHAALMPNSKAFGLSMYMIVMDISKSLSDKARSFHRSNDGGVIDQSNELGWIRTNGDFPLFWFGSIAAAHEDTPMGGHWLGKDEEVAPPPVFAIGSHRDVLDNDTERFPDPESVEKWLKHQEQYFEELLSHTDFMKHIVVPKKRGVREDNEEFHEMVHFFRRIFLIDNTVSGSAFPCRSVIEIRERVDRMTSTYWKGMKKQPLFWIYLEILLFRWSKVMKTVAAKVDEIVKLAQHPTICNISSRDEVLVALKYLANVGAILYYPQVDDLKDYVFLRPMWVIKALSTFVTAAKPGPLLEPKWNILKEKGIMSNDLMNYRLTQMRDADISDLATSLEDAGREQIEDENRLIMRLLKLLDVITPVAESSLVEFYVLRCLRSHLCILLRIGNVIVTRFLFPLLLSSFPLN